MLTTKPACPPILFQCNENHITKTFGNYRVCYCAVTDILFHVSVGLRASPEEICRTGREDSQAHDIMIQLAQCFWKVLLFLIRLEQMMTLMWFYIKDSGFRCGNVCAFILMTQLCSLWAGSSSVWVLICPNRLKSITTSGVNVKQLLCNIIPIWAVKWRKTIVDRSCVTRPLLPLSEMENSYFPIYSACVFHWYFDLRLCSINKNPSEFHTFPLSVPRLPL